MSLVHPLIRTKLRPPRTRSDLVPRLRLQQQIIQGLQGPLTLVTAPAGFGKTTLVASASAMCDSPLAWLSLDEDDNRNGRFLHYLLAALQTIDATLGQEAGPLLAAAPQVPLELVLTSLINEIEQTGQQLGLVLDDYHCLQNQGVHTAVNFLLDHCPPTFHLLIVSRSDPPLPLARLRARGQVVELRAAALGFTQAEAAQFLHESMGLRLDAASIALLAERTEGWIAGLQLAALSMRERDDVSGFITGFSGTNRYILDYLLEEVLAREPAAVQSFLLQTSILNELTAPLCDAVINGSGSQALLETLERQNLFVLPLDDERRRYRYHHLFADLLQARLQQLQPEAVAQLLTRAAVWCAANDQSAAAVSYALAAKDWQQSARLIAQYWGAFVGAGEIETVHSWLKALPEKIIRQNAPLSLAFCWIHWFTGHFEPIETQLLHAEQALASQPPPAQQDLAMLSAQLAALRALIARHQHNFEAAVLLGKEALSLLPEDLPAAAEAQLRSMIYVALASAYAGLGQLEEAVTTYTETIRWSRHSGNATGVAGITYRLAMALRLLGRLREAEAICRDALAYLRAQGMARLPAAGILHLALSELLVEQNQLEEAEKHLAQGQALGQWSGRLGAAKNAVFAQARLQLARNDLEGALLAVQEAESSLGERPSSLALSEMLALKAKLLIQQGDLAEASRCAEQAVELAGNDRGQTGQMAALAGWRVKVARNDADELVADLTSALDVAEENGRLGVALELFILRGRLHQQYGRLPQARADLASALALAAPEGFVRLFLEEGPPMRQLLTSWLAENGRSSLCGPARHLLDQFDRESTPAEQPPTALAAGLVESLSERELEVLQIIAQGKTNQAIADQLVIAKGTVKAHTANIYRKLDVANRTEAVARARELGLLP